MLAAGTAFDAAAEAPFAEPSVIALSSDLSSTTPDYLPVLHAHDHPRITPIDLTAAPEDLWERIRVGFAMPNLNTAQVTVQQASYLNRPESLKRMFDRGRRYLFHIVQELEKRGMPTELALLPMVESAFNPMALSPANASGIWQFIPSTGRSYNLKQDWWIDQRRDILASTEAALDYLQVIYEMHGDWHLALASYNWGEGAVARAIERNRAQGLPTDYASLSMPAETRNYVPKLQALKNIISQPALFGLQIDPIPNREYFRTVARPATMDVAVAARLAEMPLVEFQALNPAFNRPVMPRNGQNTIVLPVDKVEAFQRNLENHDRPLASWQTYTVKPKERLDRIAARHGISLAVLRQINGLGPKARTRPGQSLLVPMHEVLSVSAQPRVEFAPRQAAKAKGKVRTQRTLAARAAGKAAAAKTRPALRASAAKPPSRSVAVKRPGSRS
jgi:membrane-bound lytic murein transglycosylase D